MNYIIYDLEATCWYGPKSKEEPNEIFEIGAIKVQIINEKPTIIDTFQSFVKPIINPKLSKYAISLTKVEQKNLDEANTFPVVLEEFKKWIGNDYFLCSWGTSDKIYWSDNCYLHGLSRDWIRNHNNIQNRVSFDIMQRPKGQRMSLKHALEEFNIDVDGTEHRALDDALNTTKVFIQLFDKIVLYENNDLPKKISSRMLLAMEKLEINTIEREKIL